MAGIITQSSSFALGSIRSTQTVVLGATVEAGPVGFMTPRAGPFTLSVKDQTTFYTWTMNFDQPRSVVTSFTINFTAYINTSGVDNLGNSISVTPVGSNSYTVVTAAADGGGRTYTLVFTPFTATTPTIQKTAGGAIAAKLQIDAIYASPL
jgi:hypothetical protein